MWLGLSAKKNRAGNPLTRTLRPTAYCALKSRVVAHGMRFDKHILIYASDAAVRRTKQLVLEQDAYNVIAVGTVREVEYVTARSVFDLLVLGRSVSAGDKVAAAKAFKTRAPEVPILEVCDHSPCVDRPDYILRSSDPEDLSEMVDSILHGKSAGN
jgi:DNA-binding NtrC family response regulator